MATIEVTRPSSEEANSNRQLAVPSNNLTPNITLSAVSLPSRAQQCKAAARNGGRP